MSAQSLPPGRDLARRNRRLVAERTGWPAGVLEVCEKIEKVHPAWDVWWREENPFRGHETPEGYYATVWDGPRGSGTAYGADADALSAAILAASSDCPVCGRRLPVPAGSNCPTHQIKDSAEWCDAQWPQSTVPSRPAP